MGVDPQLVTAMVFVESSFRPTARCGNCVGLLQINYVTWRRTLRLENGRMLEISYNLRAGITILKHYYEMTNDVSRALQFYNCGPSGKYKSNYVNKVKAAYKMLYGVEWETK
jgi:soluble lytic murein transglycosylase-like protein